MRFLSSLQNWKKYNLNILWIEATRNFNPKKKNCFFSLQSRRDWEQKSLIFFLLLLAFSDRSTASKFCSFLLSVRLHIRLHIYRLIQVRLLVMSGPIRWKMENKEFRQPLQVLIFFFNFRHCRKYYGMALAAFSFLSCCEAKVMVKRQTIDWWPFGLAWLWSNSFSRKSRFRCSVRLLLLLFAPSFVFSPLKSNGEDRAGFNWRGFTIFFFVLWRDFVCALLNNGGWWSSNPARFQLVGKTVLTLTTFLNCAAVSTPGLASNLTGPRREVSRVRGRRLRCW